MRKAGPWQLLHSKKSDCQMFTTSSW
jgi:hypothetical protein